MQPARFLAPHTRTIVWSTLTIGVIVYTLPGAVLTGILLVAAIGTPIVAFGVVCDALRDRSARRRQVARDAYRAQTPAQRGTSTAQWSNRR